MKKTFLTALALGAALTAATPVVTYAKPHTPAKGSAERTAIMKSLHHVLGSGKHTPLITAYAFHVEKGWAYMTGSFEYADGAPLEKEFQDMPSSTNFTALLRYRGKKAGWKVMDYVYNGDEEKDEFRHNYPAAPPAIFQD